MVAVLTVMLLTAACASSRPLDENVEALPDLVVDDLRALLSDGSSPSVVNI